MIMQDYLARLEFEKDGTVICEHLSDHLINVATCCYKVVSTEPFRRALANLLASLGHVSGSEAIEVARTLAFMSGFLHDIGKIAYQLDRKVDELCKEDKRRRSLSFRGHELISALMTSHFIQRKALQHLDRVDVAVSTVIVRSVLLHHQGLRGITALSMQKHLDFALPRLNVLVKSEPKVKDYVSKLIEKAIGLTQEVIESVSVIDTLRSFNEHIQDLNFRDILIAPQRILLDHIERASRYGEINRLITGALMIADNYVTYMSVQGRGSSKYVREIAVYVGKTLRMKADECLCVKSECKICA